MITQFASIFILLASRSHLGVDIYGLGVALLWIAMIIGLVSGIQYFVLFWRRLA